VFRDQLLVEDILSFAIEKLEGDNYDETVCELASEYEDNIDKIDYLIKKLATDEDSDFNLELRKWRAIFIAKEIEDKSDNLIDGLMHLGEI